MKRLIFAVLVLLAGASVAARAADMPGSKDPAGLKRFKGSEIVFALKRSFDRYNLAQAPDMAGSAFAKKQQVLGEVDRAFYRVPAGHTALELMVNYEQALKDAGFSQTLEISQGIPDQANFANFFYTQGAAAYGDNPYYWANITDPVYVTGKKTENGHDIYVAVFIIEFKGPASLRFPGLKDPVPFAQGEIPVAVDVVTTKSAGNNMIQEKSEDMSRALAATGKAEIYGIYFDTDKTAIKPESKPTLNEVAKLLKGEPQLRLEVSGHTDNTGSHAHNMVLSEGRAKAVVQALVTDYGIDGKRLEAKGYGDTKPIASNDTAEGRATNRRVELRKI